MARNQLPPKSGHPNELLTRAEAAEILAVSPTTLRTWLRRGRIPAIQYGPRGIYRVRRGDVDAFVEASRLSPPPAIDPTPRHS